MNRWSCGLSFYRRSQLAWEWSSSTLSPKPMNSWWKKGRSAWGPPLKLGLSRRQQVRLLGLPALWKASLSPCWIGPFPARSRCIGWRRTATQFWIPSRFWEHTWCGQRTPNWVCSARKVISGLWRVWPVSWRWSRTSQGSPRLSGCPMTPTTRAISGGITSRSACRKPGR